MQMYYLEMIGALSGDDLGHSDVTKIRGVFEMAPLPFPNATFKVVFPGY